jgi:hypothetical protein
LGRIPQYGGDRKMIALIGAGIFVATVLLFWRSLPRKGKVHFLVGTKVESYFVMTFVVSAVLGLILMIYGAVQHF